MVQMEERGTGAESQLSIKTPDFSALCSALNSSSLLRAVLNHNWSNPMESSGHRLNLLKSEPKIEKHPPSSCFWEVFGLWDHLQKEELINPKGGKGE